MNKKAVALYSGGLDSLLATKLILDQGIHLDAVHYTIRFAESNKTQPEKRASMATKYLGIPLVSVDVTEEFLAILKNPAHGYGANINPCIDCKILMLTKAKERMLTTGASFVVTGEVLGERPMSQRRDTLKLIEKKAGLEGLIVRPLSAKLLDETIPEKEHIVDRGRLMDISGRSRKPQIALAKTFGMDEYQTPAGGCLLTDPGFSDRIIDLIRHDELTAGNIELLKFGRYFRLSDSAKLVVGRDEKENNVLLGLAREGDVILQVEDVPSPIAVLSGNGRKEDYLAEAASIVSHHTKARDREAVIVSYWSIPQNAKAHLSVTPSARESVDLKRV